MLSLPTWSRPFQPAMGGVIIGAMLLFVPQVMGVGYEYVDLALNGGLVFKTMVLLCVMKLVATTVSYTSGNAGGIFAPSLFIGAMAGGAVGTLVHQFAPFHTADPGAYALVGMGTLFAGIIRAPMTSVFMIFEITQDYQILVPLMVANLLSFMISRRFQPTPVYHALLQQDHVHLPSPAARMGPASWTAADVMRADVMIVPPDMSVQNLLETAGQNGAHGFVIGSPDCLVGVLTSERLATVQASGRVLEPVRAFVDGAVVHAHPDHPSDIVLERLAHGGGIVPIVSREQAQQVLGVVTLTEVLRFMQRRRGTAAPFE